MPGHLKEIGVLNSLTTVKRALDLSDKTETSEEDDFDESSWAWPNETPASNESKENGDWLQSTLVAVAPGGEIIAMARNERLVILTGKWEKSSEGDGFQRYHVTYDAVVSSESEEEITALLVVPLWSQTKSSQVIPDWFCVILGFSSGYVKFYTAEGDLLLSQFFHEEPVQYLKLCHNPEDLSEELSVFHQSVVVTVDSLGLYQTLRACRSLVAKGKAFSSREMSFEPPPLAYKKFGLMDQSKTNDCHLLGTVVPNTFDHLKTASLAGGFYARYSSTPPVSTAFLSVGNQPYCAWHYAVEGSAKLLLTDVAYALASRVKSTILTAASGWLSWTGAMKTSRADGGAGRIKEKPKSEPFSPVYPRFGMSDTSRVALNITVCPMQRLAAVSDSLGRVILIDVHRGVAIRMWKGYREAQCGWIEASENLADDLSSQSKPHPRTTLFLVILMAKRGVVEIWTAQQGPRIAAFNVVKGTRLLYTAFKSRVQDSVQGSERSSCWLLYPNGKLDRVVVAFHCALRGDSSKRARDLHLLQKVKGSLRRGELNSNLDVLLEMRCAGIINQTIDLIVEADDVDPPQFLRCLDAVILQYDRAEALDAESRLLMCRCRLLSRLARLFVGIKEFEDRPPDYDSVTNSNSDETEDLAALLQATPQELGRIAERDSAEPVPENETLPVTFGEFLQSFDLSSCHGDVEQIRLKTGLSNEIHHGLASFVFRAIFRNGSGGTAKFCNLLRESLIQPEHLASLVIVYGLSHLGRGSVSRMALLYKLLEEITRLAGSCVKASDDSEESPWWRNIRNQISKTSNIEAAYCTALVCRSVTFRMDKNAANTVTEDKKKTFPGEQAMEDSFGEWEDYSSDLVQWNVVLKQLEDLLSLHDLISFDPSRLRALHSSRLDSSTDIKLSASDLSFSLSSIVERGRGSVSELIARWLTQNLLDVDVLIPAVDTATESEQHSSIPEIAVEAGQKSDTDEELNRLRRLFSEVRTCLPHSSERDVLLLNVSLEYAALWSRHPKRFYFLEKSVQSALAVRATLLRHGMCRLLWSMSISPIFQDLAKLMDKAGRLPRSTAGRKFPLPTNDMVVPFLSMAIQLLEALVSAGMVSETPPLVRYDDLWTTSEGATPVLDVALRQRIINIDLTVLHIQLAQVLQLISALAIKGVHAFALFEQSLARFALFHELHTHPPLPSQGVDPLVSSNRLQFLTLIVTKAVDILDENQTEALDFIGRAMKLGYEWSVDVDNLRIHFVVLLYNAGRDSLASEMLPSIEGREKVASGLLRICGSRLQKLFKPEDRSSLSPASATWLNSCEPSPPLISEPSFEETRRLLLEVLYRLNPASKEYSIASELQKCLATL